jgi:hypothetical protein
VGHEVQIQVTFHHTDVEKLMLADIMMQFGPLAIVEAIETWKECMALNSATKPNSLRRMAAGIGWSRHWTSGWNMDGNLRS